MADQSTVTAYRGVAARARLLSEGRRDLAFAAKELRKGMSTPEDVHVQQAKVLGDTCYIHRELFECFVPKYLRSPRTPSVTTTWQLTRKGTLGGTLMLGITILQEYSRNQDLIGDSSGEDEYYAICSVAKESLGM